MRTARLCLSVAATLLVALSASSCGSVDAEEGQASGETDARSPVAGRGATDDARELASANADFAFDLYGRLASRPGNIFLSPHSISTALGMTYAGARARTADQMASALRLPSLAVDASTAPQASDEYRALLAQAFGSLSSSVGSESSSGGHVLAEANALWGHEGHPFLDTFLSLNRDGFGAGLSRLDFEGDVEGARQTINAWVEEKTQGKIEDLIRRGDLDPLVRIVLTNAVYFKGRWAEQFDAGSTRDAAFHREPGNPDMDVTVPMMARKGEYGYARVEGQGIAVAELPYEGGGASMLVILPDEGAPGGLKALEERLDRGSLDEWVSQLGKREILLSLPRFDMTWGTENIIPELEALGMVDLFSDGADLSGIDGTQELYVSRVLHKAFVEVNEEGTEAAAATAVIGRLKASMPLEFRADRPFLFLIRDVETGSILFMGRVTDPTA
ncbi:MAG: serpin family protein [Candidatus Eisenbacteria bacterium]